MRLLLQTALALIGLLGLGIAAIGLVAPGPRGDFDYRPSVAKPAYLAHKGPAVCIDHGHYNTHRANGTYLPFKRLLEADGYRVALVRGRFTASALEYCDLLVIANARGGGKPRLLGVDLPLPVSGAQEAAAFTPAEVAALSNWVKGGGSLLLATGDHPFGAAGNGLARAFGISLLSGAARQNVRPGTNPILNGVTRVATFTGRSLVGSGTPLLLRSEGVQAVALEFGLGCLVIVGDAAALTAQRENDRGWGFAATNDNEQLVLNIARWLSRKL